MTPASELAPPRDATDDRLLERLQDAFPLVPEPFAQLAEALETDAADVIARIGRLKADRAIRQISPIYDTKQLGYDSALVAFKVPSDRIEAVAEVVSGHPGVSHNYERAHDYNLWFTLAIPPTSPLGVEGTVAVLAKETGIDQTQILRSTRTFKIRVRLDTKAGLGSRREAPPHAPAPPPSAPLTEREREIVRVTQDDLALVERPFDAAAQTLGMSTSELLEALADLLARGVMRRFAAILFHRRVGYGANGMGVWNVPEARVEEVGLKLAAFRAVSHCYDRTTSGDWPYRLFSMFHATTEAELAELVAEASRETGIDDYLVLRSLREFKKRRVRYFVPDGPAWEAAHGGADA